MAAAEYYNAGPRPSITQQPILSGPPQPQRASSNPTMTFTPPAQQLPPGPQQQPYQPQYPPPPPYHQHHDEDKPGVHFAPPPMTVQSQGHRPSNSYPQAQNQMRPQYLAPSPNGRPGPYPGPYNPHSYSYQNPTYSGPAGQLTPYSDKVDYGYISDPENHRRRHKHRTTGERRISDHSRSTNADGFLGAAGGGLIGDLIFPGLGTVGGALAGWIGGKDYGKHRKWREDKRDREQEDWERKFSHGSRSRSRSHSRDRRRGSHDSRKSYN